MIKPSETVIGGVYTLVKETASGRVRGVDQITLCLLKDRNITTDIWGKHSFTWVYEDIARYWLYSGSLHGVTTESIDRLIGIDDPFFTAHVPIEDLPLYLYLPFKSKNFERLLSGQKPVSKPGRHQSYYTRSKNNDTTI